MTSQTRQKAWIREWIFVQEGFQIKRNYTEDLEKLFQCACQTVDFNEDRDNAIRSVNAFVEAHTKDNVHDLLLPVDVIPYRTKVILVNALYFRACWEQQFSPSKTSLKPFTTAEGISVPVETMHKKFINYKYHESKELGGAMFLELPFTSKYCSAVFILPGKKKVEKHYQLPWKKKHEEPASPDQGLAELINMLTAEKLNHALEQLSCALVTVQLPRFRVEQSVDMKHMLIALGMPTAFDERKADFSGICNLFHDRLHIHAVKQKACIDLNEEGMEASVSTVVVLSNMGGYDAAEFIADRPFLFLIRHVATDTILFMGHVSDPSV
ncbi:serpin B10-like [Paramacrobiotus metropolitanus]|uniref:serpin B10-like n=1 Tax=Paramacrobiotus metropolitanus TaxID=2943436 RepID=UPI0024462083|nr:serpin B10-like [Paramacrobiotus metropolitanus]